MFNIAEGNGLKHGYHDEILNKTGGDSLGVMGESSLMYRGSLNRDGSETKRPSLQTAECVTHPHPHSIYPVSAPHPLLRLQKVRAPMST
ncbi:predicted protein [Plenodomus lingam JN3]|uniref:Predicted protein n=1 Tax=Leptosphaeria maculans (strain JN3 / isolate v23.1.3 / race Av1-4-5-6-7-8) TaxID=985895 RepID=E5A5I4_LEPMJ|nr:predicted protein [Plenodomus lingam JN3]CBX98882.1 predicted protein [Plenodomus lingam JN3]